MDIWALAELVVEMQLGFQVSGTAIGGRRIRPTFAVRTCRSSRFVLVTMPPVAAIDDHSVASFNVNDPVKPSPGGKMRRRHSVDFVGDKPKTHEFDCLDEDEKGEVWYSRDEYDIIKARNSLIVKMMKSGAFEENTEQSFRGLEHKLKEGFRQRRENKFNALNAVLEVQDRQYDKGQTCQEVIAQAYRRVSLNAKESAFMLGCRDAEESFCFAGKRRQSAKSIDGLLADEEEEESVDEIETDVDTVCSDMSKTKKNRMSKLFGKVSRKRFDSNKLSRRTSM